MTATAITMPRSHGILLACDEGLPSTQSSHDRFGWVFDR